MTPRQKAVERIERCVLVPVVRAPSPDLAIEAVAVLADTGIEIFEITMTVPRATDVMRALTSRFEGRALIGAGTVLDAEQARQCLDAGARFIVSPGFDPDMIPPCHDADVPILPGALTPTEVIRAHRAGADLVKIFPCSAMGGASYLRALKAPLPGVRLMPTGGVSVETVAAYLDAGAAALGVGSDLVDTKALAAGEPDRLRRRARAYLSALEAARPAS